MVVIILTIFIGLFFFGFGLKWFIQSQKKKARPKEEAQFGKHAYSIIFLIIGLVFLIFWPFLYLFF